MDGDRREIPGGAVSARDGEIEAVGTTPPAQADTFIDALACTDAAQLHEEARRAVSQLGA